MSDEPELEAEAMKMLGGFMVGLSGLMREAIRPQLRSILMMYVQESLLDEATEAVIEVFLPRMGLEDIDGLLGDL